MFDIITLMLLPMQLSVVAVLVPSANWQLTRCAHKATRKVRRKCNHLQDTSIQVEKFFKPSNQTHKVECNATSYTLQYFSSELKRKREYDAAGLCTCWISKCLCVCVQWAPEQARIPAMSVYHLLSLMRQHHWIAKVCPIVLFLVLFLAIDNSGSCSNVHFVSQKNVCSLKLLALWLPILDVQYFVLLRAKRDILPFSKWLYGIHGMQHQYWKPAHISSSNTSTGYL